MQENPAELRLAARDSGAMLADFALVTAGPAQKHALESVAQGVPTLAYGPPRSGKSSLCGHAAWESMRGGVDPRTVVLLAPRGSVQRFFARNSRGERWQSALRVRRFI